MISSTRNEASSNMSMTREELIRVVNLGDKTVQLFTDSQKKICAKVRQGTQEFFIPSHCINGIPLQMKENINIELLRGFCHLCYFTISSFSEENEKTSFAISLHPQGKGGGQNQTRAVNPGAHGVPEAAAPTIQAPPLTPDEILWLRPREDFLLVPTAEMPPPEGGASPIKQFFRDRQGARWFGKNSGFVVSLQNERELRTVLQEPGCMGKYTDETLEKLGLAIYALLGVSVPETCLSYQLLSAENQQMAQDVYDYTEPPAPLLHFLSKFIEDFHPFPFDFLEQYRAEALTLQTGYCHVVTPSGERLELRGVGKMAAAANLMHDIDCWGNSCGNAGYQVKTDAQGQRYASLIKIDAGFAFSYYEPRFANNQNDPRERRIRVKPSAPLGIGFAEFSPSDREEFAQATKVALTTPNEIFATLFARIKSETLGEAGIVESHRQGLLEGLLARKALFLAAFAPETDVQLVREIEARQASRARALDENPAATFEAPSMETVAALRAHLAGLQTRHVTGGDGSCRTYQLPPTNTQFTGREASLITLAQHLQQGQGAVIGQTIVGFGGVGKTQLAARYAQAAAAHEPLGEITPTYEYILWFHAERALDAQFQTLAEVFLQQPGLHAGVAVAAIYDFLRRHPTLIVFDNAETPENLLPYLPPQGYQSPLHLLITSRNPHWPGLPTLKMETFTTTETQALIEKVLGAQDKTLLEEVHTLLGGLPLALTQMLAYVQASHCSLQDYPQQFRLNQADLASHDLLLQDPHPQRIATTLTLSLAQAQRLSPHAEMLLSLSAYVAADAIPVPLLVQASALSEALVQQGIAALERYALVTRDGNTISLHRLTQEVMRHKHTVRKTNQSWLERLIPVLQEYLTYDNSSLTRIAAATPYLAHALTCANQGERLLPQEGHLQVALLWDKYGEHAYYSLGQAQQGCMAYEHTLAIAERHFGPEHPEVAITLSNLGNAYGDLGDTARSIALLERALAIEEHHYGPEHPKVAKTLVNLSKAYSALGDTARQKSLLERALPILERHYGPEHPQVAKTLTNLGDAYGALGDTERKKALLQRALTIQERHYAPEHPEVARTLTNLGDAYRELGDIARSKALLERALPIQERHYGPEHPEVALTLINLGIAYGDFGDTARKKALLERALAINERHYGPEHPNVAITLINLGNAYGDLGDTARQKALLERALAIFKHAFGREHAYTQRAQRILQECDNVPQKAKRLV